MSQLRGDGTSFREMPEADSAMLDWLSAEEPLSLLVKPP
jgi:hypothetical protein